MLCSITGGICQCSTYKGTHKSIFVCFLNHSPHPHQVSVSISMTTIIHWSVTNAHIRHQLLTQGGTTQFPYLDVNIANQVVAQVVADVHLLNLSVLVFNLSENLFEELIKVLLCLHIRQHNCKTQACTGLMQSPNQLHSVNQNKSVFAILTLPTVKVTARKLPISDGALSITLMLPHQNMVPLFKGYTPPPLHMTFKDPRCPF